MIAHTEGGEGSGAVRDIELACLVCVAGNSCPEVMDWTGLRGSCGGYFYTSVHIWCEMFDEAGDTFFVVSFLDSRSDADKAPSQIGYLFIFSLFLNHINY